MPRRRRHRGKSTSTPVDAVVTAPIPIPTPPPAPKIPTRRAGRVLLITDTNQILLLEADDRRQPGQTFWTTPGGGAEPGETLHQAATRELLEETGLTGITLAGPVWVRHRTVHSGRDRRHNHEEYFLARIPAPVDIDTSGWTDFERDTIIGWRWWNITDLASTTTRIIPGQLATELPSLLTAEIPTQPIRLRR